MKCLGQDLAHTPCTRRAHAVHTPCTRNARYVERVANRVVQRTVRTTRSYPDIFFPPEGAMGRAIEDVFGYLAVVGVFCMQLQAMRVTYKSRAVQHPPLLCIASIYVTSILWAGYGSAAGQAPVVLAAALTIAQQSVILVLIAYHAYKVRASSRDAGSPCDAQPTEVDDSAHRV